MFRTRWHGDLVPQMLARLLASQKAVIPAKSGYQVRRGLGDSAERLWNTGSPACAGDDGCEWSAVRIDTLPACENHTTGLTPGSAVTSSRNRAPRISKLRYWSNDAQAGDSSTTGSASPEASASRAALTTATSSVSLIS